MLNMNVKISQYCLIANETHLVVVNRALHLNKSKTDSRRGVLARVWKKKALEFLFTQPVYIIILGYNHFSANRLSP